MSAFVFVAALQAGVENRRSRPSRVTLRCYFHACVGAISQPGLVVPLLAHPGDVRRRGAIRFANCDSHGILPGMHLGHREFQRLYRLVRAADYSRSKRCYHM